MKEDRPAFLVDDKLKKAAKKVAKQYEPLTKEEILEIITEVIDPYLNKRRIDPDKLADFLLELTQK